MIAALSLLGLSFVGWGVASTRRVLYPEAHLANPPTPLPSYQLEPVIARDGVSFNVWRLEAPAPRARLLLYHGYYANVYQVLGIGERLRQRGYEVLIVELRGHGARPGPCTVGLNEADDGTAVIEWARHRDGTRPLPLGVLGLSMGAAVICQIALRSQDVRAVVVDSVYARLFPVLRGIIRQRYHLPGVPWAWLTWWGLQLALRRRLARYDPIALAPQLRQPLFAIQGGADQRIEPRLGQELYAAWAGPKERWFEPTVAHVGMFAERPEEYTNRVAGFFDRTLS